MTQSLKRGFIHCLNRPVSSLCWFALLPSYLERNDASLVHMMRQFIDDGTDGGGFYLDRHDQLQDDLQRAINAGREIALIGVSFALLKLATEFNPDIALKYVIETGGMKGRLPEITRPEVHRALKEGLGVSRVGSEYGMTELLSQAWSVEDGIFNCSATMRVLVRELQDPVQVIDGEARGGLNVIDLANIDSCAFLSVDDIGRRYPDGTFTVDGRLDGSEQRGCNLMAYNSAING